MNEHSAGTRAVKFGAFELDLTAGELRKNGLRVRLQEQPFRLLAFLVERPGELVSREDLREKLWASDTYVDFDNSLNTAASKLREALGDSASSSRFIETLPRRGYRFLASVESVGDASPSASDWPAGDSAGPTASLPTEKKEVGVGHAFARVPTRERLAWLIAALGVAGTLAMVSLYFRQAPSETREAPLRRFGFTPPIALRAGMGAETHPNIAVSPNGQHIVFTAWDESGLWIHELEEGTSRPLEGTEKADDPFWSPDSDFIGYSDRSAIKTIPARGGTPIQVYGDRGPRAFPKGGAWSPDGNSIVFSARDNLYEVPAQGGVPKLLVSPEEIGQSSEPSKGPTGSIRWPHFLPPEAGARVLVYTFGSGTERTMMVHDLESGRREVLGSGELPFYSPSGHLLYQAGPAAYDLWALPFSLDTLQATGRAFLVAQKGWLPTIASDQTLVYLDVADSSERWQLVWRDREGNKLGTIGEPHSTNIVTIALSPDGRRVAVAAAENLNFDIWIHEVDRPVKTRLTTHEGTDWQPRWSPKGDRVAFSSARSGARDVYVVTANGSEEPSLLFGSPDFRDDLNDWSEDESILVLSRYPGPEIFYLRRKETGDGHEEVPFLENASEGRLSPDGRYLAYQSGQSGTPEIYVRSFPHGEDRQRVSVNGGTRARWRRDGKELFYVQGDTLMAVPVSTSPRLAVGSPRRLFSVHGSVLRDAEYDVTADGQRFVVPEPVGESSSPIRVVLNWYEEFRVREHGVR